MPLPPHLKNIASAKDLGESNIDPKSKLFKMPVFLPVILKLQASNLHLFCLISFQPVGFFVLESLALLEAIPRSKCHLDGEYVAQFHGWAGFCDLEKLLKAHHEIHCRLNVRLLGFVEFARWRTGW